MDTKKSTQRFSLLGAWKLTTADKSLSYAFPEIIEFKEKNTYSVAGKEGAYHPILDGGWYEYNTSRKELAINTANDAIKKYALREKGDSLTLLENDKVLAAYVKEK
ncbi:MAG: hypothetical protein ABIQ88_18305 [Chitinophagaceae bacterium]